MRAVLSRKSSILVAFVGFALLPVNEPVAWSKPVQRREPAASWKRLSEAEARSFVVSLINRDRKRAGLPPVVLDEAASKAGRRHARDMASHGFTGHVGSDGSTPEQRYTASGGVHFVQENAACLFDTTARELEEEPRFDARKLAALHDMFMAEVPPNDGHRRNVLAPLHNRVGIGVAQPSSVDQPCLAQEFVDQYGEYEPLPREASPGAEIRVAGSVKPPLVFGGIGVGRTAPPKPVPRERLNSGSYRIPAPDTMYFPAGFKTPKPVKLEGGRFSIELALDRDSRAGSHAITVWAKHADPSKPKLFMISMRTIAVR